MATTRKGALAKSAEDLLAAVRSDSTTDRHCDVLIIGSGYGGSVAAARLAGSTVTDADGKSRNAKIWLLERGAEYLPGDFPARFSELAGHVRFTMQDGKPPRGADLGLFDVRVGSDVSTLLASGLGGGSLINAGVMAMPAEEIFDSQWPEAIELGDLKTHYDTAKATLGVERIPEANDENDKTKPLTPRKLAFLDQIAPTVLKPERAEVTIHWAENPVPPSDRPVLLQPCTNCGDCMTGCNQNAKGSLDTSYLAKAFAGGAEMFCGATVECIEQPASEDAPWNVLWHFTEKTFRETDGDDQPIAQLIRATQVVLAAGSLGSTEILIRSRARGLNLSDKLGQNFSTNGDTMVAFLQHREEVNTAADPETDPADKDARQVGSTINGIARLTTANGTPFVMEEFGVPAALRRVFGEVAATFGAFRGTSQPGPDPRALTDDAIDHMGLVGVMGDDGAAGSLRLPVPKHPPKVRAVEAGLCIDWQDYAKQPFVTSVNDWLATRFGAGTRDISIPMLDAEDASVAITVHPLGGCRMGDSISRGVVDDRGRVFKPGGGVHAGLVVLDGSIIPRALGINPSLTITALAERAMPLLMKEWGFQAAVPGALPAQKPELPREAARRRELPPMESVWTLRECMKGPFKLSEEDGQHWRAEMELEFEPIPGIARTMQLARRNLIVRRGSLKLYAPDAEPHEAPIAEAHLAGQLNLFMPNRLRDNPDNVTLSYQLSIQGLRAPPGFPLAVGGRLDGVKTFGQISGVKFDATPSIWRQLTEMAVSYNGSAVGTWKLDLGDLADRREALARIDRLSSMPDALGDLGSIALYALRRSWPVIQQAYHTISDAEPLAPNLNQRYPGAIAICEPGQPIPVGTQGALLTRYEQASDKPPVVLLHGLGASGSSYTDPSIPNNLVSVLHAAGRDVWVLDVRSSIGNERGRQDSAADDWTVEGVAQADIPDAVDLILAHTQADQVDFFSHCMGGIMFCMAALGSTRLTGKIRSAVMSQTGPLLRLSPLNRFRGYAISYLQQYFRMKEVDTCPDFASEVRADGRIVWGNAEPRGQAGKLMDALLSTYPYPNGDGEADRVDNTPLGETDFRRIRHRADAIFGQLFELKQVADATLARLDALLGWVKVPMLAEAIHFARQQMVTDAQGLNVWLSGNKIGTRFHFPVLMIHGRRNRVFRWRGGLDSLKLLKQVRGETLPAPVTTPAAGVTLHGANTPTQLAVFDGFGHLDCIIGQDAGTRIFPMVRDFLAAPPALAPPPKPLPVLRALPLWIGPLLGWMQHTTDPMGRPWVSMKVLMQPQPATASTAGLVIVPVRMRGGAPTADPASARLLPWPAPGSQEATTIDLLIRRGALDGQGHCFAVFSLHDDQLPSAAGGPVVPGPFATAFPGPAAFLAQGQTLANCAFSNPIDPIALSAVQQLLESKGAELLRDATFCLPPNMLAAVDQGKAWDINKSGPVPSLHFAMASCQYPPGLFDEPSAGAAYTRLLRETQVGTGPQLLLAMGDQVYLDATAGVFDPPSTDSPQGAVTSNAQRLSYELNWRMKPMRRTLARLPFYPMLDDHEVSNDWNGELAEPVTPDILGALVAYKRYQQDLAPSTPVHVSSSRSYCFYPAGLPVFVMDTRSHRSRRSAGTMDTATILPAAALDKLVEALADLPAALPKFVVLPSPLLPPERCLLDNPAHRMHSDTWTGFPASASTLLCGIRDKNIRKVILLSGDAHLSSVSTFELEGAEEDNRVVCIVSSGLYAPWPFANQAPADVLLTGSFNPGTSTAPCFGAIRLQAMSTAWGFADVQADQNPDGSTRLAVSLRAVTGSSVDCELTVR